MNAVMVMEPSNYEAARNALALCERIDECQTWANKAAALAVYGRQSNDDTLIIMAQRIQARAIRRCGELLKATPTNRVAVADAAGLTRLQRNQAVSVAQIPAPKFDCLVDSAKPPRIYQLAQIGTHKRSLSRTTKARTADLKAEIKRLELKRIQLGEKLQRTLAQIAQARRDLAAIEAA